MSENLPSSFLSQLNEQRSRLSKQSRSYVRAASLPDRLDEAVQRQTVLELAELLKDKIPIFAPFVPTEDPSDRRDDTLEDLVPLDPTKPYDMTQVIERVVDEGSFMQVLEAYAMNMIVGFARLGGHSVGIVANQPMHLAGCLDIDASVKLAVLLVEGDAANEQGQCQFMVRAVLFKCFRDLGGKFARWCKDQGARHPGARTA